jgi:hypothetical protein
MLMWQGMGAIVTGMFGCPLLIIINTDTCYLRYWTTALLLYPPVLYFCVADRNVFLSYPFSELMLFLIY